MANPIVPGFTVLQGYKVLATHQTATNVTVLCERSQIGITAYAVADTVNTDRKTDVWENPYYSYNWHDVYEEYENRIHHHLKYVD